LVFVIVVVELVTRLLLSEFVIQIFLNFVEQCFLEKVRKRIFDILVLVPLSVFLVFVQILKEVLELNRAFEEVALVVDACALLYKIG
jgi:hypothetical protein